ncbi:MAG: hypothetical protein WC595_00225 [Candidatus Nanoarchaeia archaeon]
MNTNAQIAITDLFFALIIFIILMTAFSFFWTLYLTRFNDNLQRQELELLAYHISDLLVKTPGYPDTWEQDPNNTRILGLAKQDRVLSQEKISAFANLTYNQTKTIFNIERYNYYLLIQKNGTALYETNTLPSGSSVSVRRTATYDNQPTLVQFTLGQ